MNDARNMPKRGDYRKPHWIVDFQILVSSWSCSSRMDSAPATNRRISRVIEVGREESFRFVENVQNLHFVAISGFDSLSSFSFHFRSSLANQKQRLLKQTQVLPSRIFISWFQNLQLNNQFEAQKVQVDLKAKEEEKTKKKSFLGVLRKISFRTRKTSKEEASSPPPASPPALLLPPPIFSPPPLELPSPPTPPPSPAVVRTPVPQDSPLLQKAVPQVRFCSEWRQCRCNCSRIQY